MTVYTLLTPVSEFTYSRPGNASHQTPIEPRPAESRQKTWVVRLLGSALVPA